MESHDKHYIYSMAKTLKLDVDYLFSLIEKMNNNDLTYFYFYFGQYFASDDKLIKKKIVDIIHRYQREDKFKRIIK